MKWILKGNGCDIPRTSCTHRSGERDAFQREKDKKKSISRHRVVKLQNAKAKHSLKWPERNNKSQTKLNTKKTIRMKGSSQQQPKKPEDGGIISLNID